MTAPKLPETVRDVLAWVEDGMRPPAPLQPGAWTWAWQNELLMWNGGWQLTGSGRAALRGES